MNLFRAEYAEIAEGIEIKGIFDCVGIFRAEYAEIAEGIDIKGIFNYVGWN